MKALIVVDSVYGNTEKIAKAIAEGLAPVETRLVRPAGAGASDLQTIDLLLVGSPVQGGRATKPIQDFLSKIPGDALDHKAYAAFDTRVKSGFAKIFGYAANRISGELKGKGGDIIAEPQGFLVKGKEGPLAEGELDKAKDWGKSLSAKLNRK